MSIHVHYIPLVNKTLMLPKDSEVLIIGGGTWGLSTALWLLREKYTNVTIIDSEEIPSTRSAGNDINKIIRIGYTSKFHSLLEMEGAELWRNDPLFSPFFHEVGYLVCTSEEAPFRELNLIRQIRLEMDRRNWEELRTKEDIISIAPILNKGTLPGWHGYFQRDEGGWVHAANTMRAVANEIKLLGGKFIIDEVKSLSFSDGIVTGCKSISGKEYFAKKVVLATGASSVKFLDFKNQLMAKCWTLGHIKLTAQEAELLKGIPVIRSLEGGFFFEPDANNEMKICNEFPGYTNYINDGEGPNSSVPDYRNSIPVEAKEGIRKLLQETIPDFKDKPIVMSKICWCTDTPDRYFLIDEHPDYKGTLVLATGDSGHGFQHIPLIGKYISKLIVNGREGLDEEMREKWRWRPETVSSRIQNRYGGTGLVKDLKDIKDWI